MRSLFFKEFRFLSSLLLLSLFIIEPLAAEKPKSALNDEQQTRQILARLTFGARPADFERVHSLGVKAYIEEQLDPDSIDDSALAKRLEKLPTLALSTPTLAEQYNPPKPPPTPTSSVSPSPSPTPNAAMMQNPAMSADSIMKANSPEMPKSAETPTPANVSTAPAPKPSPTPAPKNPQIVVTELQRAKLLRAVYSERQLNEVMVDFWENHFSIYANKDADRWLLTEFDRDAIRPFVFGRFRDLLGATAHSPAMLYYLDNWQSSVLRKYPATKDKPARQNGGINENYARELMELHTLGVNGGYTQKDVQELARCLTGWTIRKPNEEGVFYYNPQTHDNGEKTVLGHKIAAGGGIGDVEKVLDILAQSPATAKFISTKLARRFLGDNPPETVINQAAQVFLKTDGSIRETVRSIITSPAFLSPAMYQTKIKSPFEFVAASLRITGAETDANRPILDWITRMGEPVFGHITPEGVPEKSDEWLSSGSLLVRFNFADALAENKIKGTTIDVKNFLGDADLSKPEAVADRLIQTILQSDITNRSKNALDKIAADAAVKLNTPKPEMSAPDGKMKTPDQKTAAAKMPEYVAQLLTLTLGTPEFQRK